MRRALVLAARGPATGQNPQVGCVILSAAGDTLAEGWHGGVGTAHAEVDALSKLAPGAARGATAVVTLEPCNHTGHTGPCSEALIEAGIARVFYVALRPQSRRPRRGAAAPQRRGGGGRRGAGGGDRRILHDWLVATRLGRPYITLKWASSLDGRSAAADGSSQWITGPAARERRARQRAKVDAILVGTGTVSADDPSLTARGADGALLPHQPIPVVVGERPVPVDARLFAHPEPAIVTVSRDLNAVLARLFARGVRRVIVEGGPTLTRAFVAAGLVDEY